MITTKRQATLPKSLCDDLGVAPGDSLQVEKRVLDGETVWLLRPKSRAWDWVGSAAEYAKGKSHGMRDVHESIGRARAAAKGRP